MTVPTACVTLDGDAVEVDRDVAPLVRWLAHQPGVRVLASSQGADADETPGVAPADAFAAFSCDRWDSLARILHAFAAYRLGRKARGLVEVEAESIDAQVRFTARFAERFALVDFVKFSPLDVLHPG